MLLGNASIGITPVCVKYLKKLRKNLLSQFFGLWLVDPNGLRSGWRGGRPLRA